MDRYLDCGKSSLVKAGLIPHLADQVTPVYVETTSQDTEQRLLAALRKHCPYLAPKSSLGASLRRKGEIPTGQKVLLILDQFEQYLHATSAEEQQGMIDALRECDGETLQCLLMVRDDFITPVSGFINRLGIQLSQKENYTIVNRFDRRHAKKALALFGQAYGAVDKSGQVPPELDAFLNQAISGLAEGDEVICVRLALFAQMIKGKDWTPAMLKDVGGAQGVGEAFLENSFDAETAPLENRNWHVNSVTMTMLKIPIGSFVRKDDDEIDAIEQKVTLTRSFLISDREVTVKLFEQFINDRDPNVQKPTEKWEGAYPDYSPTKQHPVQQVSWYDAVLFCNWLSRKDEIDRAQWCYTISDDGTVSTKNNHWKLSGYRLPREAEWEYACRAGTETIFSHGNEVSLLDRYAVYESSRLELPGSKRPNAWGLFDVHGNIWEWCQDPYEDYGSQVTLTDPTGPAQGEYGRVLRGGSFDSAALFARSAYRVRAHPSYRSYTVGFRSARTYP